QVLNAFASAYQNGIVGFIVGQLESEIRLHAGAYVRRSAMVNRPSAIVVLVTKDLARCFLQALFIAGAQQGMQQDVVGFESGVGLEFTAPVAVRLLRGEQQSTRAVQRRSYAAGDVIDLAKDHLHRATGDFVHTCL